MLLMSLLITSTPRPTPITGTENTTEAQGKTHLSKYPFHSAQKAGRGGCYHIYGVEGHATAERTRPGRRCVAVRFRSHGKVGRICASYSSIKKKKGARKSRKEREGSFPSSCSVRGKWAQSENIQSSKTKEGSKSHFRDGGEKLRRMYCSLVFPSPPTGAGYGKTPLFPMKKWF